MAVHGLRRPFFPRIRLRGSLPRAMPPKFRAHPQTWINGFGRTPHVAPSQPACQCSDSLNHIIGSVQSAELQGFITTPANPATSVTSPTFSQYRSAPHSDPPHPPPHKHPNESLHVHPTRLGLRSGDKDRCARYRLEPKYIVCCFSYRSLLAAAAAA